MRFKETYDVDGNGLPDAAEKPQENPFDLDKSNEIAESFAREGHNPEEGKTQDPLAEITEGKHFENPYAELFAEQKAEKEMPLSPGEEGSQKLIDSEKEPSGQGSLEQPLTTDDTDKTKQQGTPWRNELADCFAGTPLERSTNGTQEKDAPSVSAERPQPDMAAGEQPGRASGDAPLTQGPERKLPASEPRLDAISTNETRDGTYQTADNIQESDEATPALEATQISDFDREKLSRWKYKPDEHLYLEHKEVYDNPKYYNQETGEINWPPNGGAVGEPYAKTLQPGDVIDRYGLDTGSYVSPLGVSYEERAVAPGTENQPYSQFEVVKPFDVSASKVAPWFAQPGGGIQYKTPSSIEDLLDDGYIRRI